MKIYCQDCGHPNAYTSKKPNFCQNCGKGMNETATAHVSPQEPEDEVVEYSDFSNIDGLDVEIEQNRVRGVTLEDAVSMGGPLPEDSSTKSRNPRKKRRMSKKAAKKIFDDLQSSAGTMRRSNKND